MTQLNGLKDSVQTKQSFNLDKTINSLVFVVGLGIIAHLVFLLLTNEQNVFQYLQRIELYYIVLILCCLLYNWIGHAFRLMIWTRYLGQGFNFRQALKIAIYTELGAAITPTLIGGGPIKLALLMKQGISTGKAGFLTLLNGFEDFIMYSIIVIIAFFHAKQSIFKIFRSILQFVQENILQASIGMALLLSLILLSKKYKIFKSVKLIPQKYKTAWSDLKHELTDGWSEMISCFKQIQKTGLKQLLSSVFILFTQWMSKFSVLLILLLALDIDFKPFQVYLQQWIVYLTMIFIPTPGASGGAEATFFLLFEKQLPKDLLPLIISTWRFFMYYLMLFVAVSIIQALRLFDNKKN